MDGHTQRGLDDQRALCEREHGRIEAERRRAEPLVRVRHTIAEYDVIQRIGRRSQTWRPLGQFYGCMGAAFQVKPHAAPGPLLVIKVVLNEPTHGGATHTEADVVEKFRSEIEFTGDPERLPPHRNLPFTYHYFVGTARSLPDLDWMIEYTDCDTLCVVMEHIDGTSLQSLAGQLDPADVGGASGAGGDALPLPEAMLLSYAEQLLSAIAHLKEHGIVHRDIKPDNVMVSGAFRQFLRLIDFGCAISVLESGFTFPLQPGGSKGGAIEYMSPEIQRARTGEQLDYSKNDEFSAGLTLWRLLTAEPPFGRDNLAAVTDADFIGVPPGYGECSNRLLRELLRVDCVERLAALDGVQMIEAARVAAQAEYIPEGEPVEPEPEHDEPEPGTQPGSVAALEQELQQQLAARPLQPVRAFECKIQKVEASSFRQDNPRNRPEHVLDYGDLTDDSYWCALLQPDPNYIVIEFETETTLHSIKYVSKKWENSGCPKVLHIINADTTAKMHVARGLPDAPGSHKNVTHTIQLPFNVSPAKRIRLEAEKHGKWFCFVMLEFRGWSQQAMVVRRAVEQARITEWSDRLKVLAGWNCPISDGAISEAAKAGDAAAVYSMLTQGVHPDDLSTGEPPYKRRTALQQAADCGHEEVVAVLLKNGATVDLACQNYCGPSGVTPLIIAAFKGHSLVVSQLLAAGASISAKCSSGTGALEWAKKAKRDECVAVLENHQ